MSLKQSQAVKKQGQIEVPRRIAVVFPGQGSQTVGMLNELAESYPIVEQTFSEASEALGFDLWAICQDEAELAKTEYTQPALLAASIAVWRILQDTTDIEPLYLAGHSLGEYSALCAAGAISLGDAVQLVHTRGQLMQQAVSGIETKMAAVLGLDNSQVISICEQVESNDDDAIASPANFNSPGQVVVAGNAKGMEILGQHIQCTGKKMVPLKVSVPSHTSLMQPASDALAEKLAQCEFELPEIPVIQNRHAHEEKTVAAIKKALAEQLSHPVLWTQTMQKLADKHINLIIECGAGTVLSNLAKRQETPIVAFPTDKPERLTKLFDKLNEE
ncbi:ACP S-malonyltransferase [Psychrobacter sp. FDAARGOS_221]|uniref:ACP S-malonyltransferase n=1 Tax=Psychrobacter sp. FDAARGOS_221 TaxID=1975705 RepID=UPI000BB57800|nr:ACP S-malonyltransferase [Psychrobacter sp. FDAARGOS_221]PNK60301.1 [acyl-carrier-protein] S-malonyltransferase [Psychrobacter sp. FDAARGOS_221]